MGEENKTKQKRSVQAQDGTVVLMEQSEALINMASGFTLQLIFKKLPLLGCLGGSAS